MLVSFGLAVGVGILVCLHSPDHVIKRNEILLMDFYLILLIYSKVYMLRCALRYDVFRPVMERIELYTKYRVSE